MTPSPKHRLWLIAAPVLTVSLTLAGCAAIGAGEVEDAQSTTQVQSATEVQIAETQGAVEAQSADEVLGENQQPHDEDADDADAEATRITLSGTSATIDGDGAAVDGGDVVVSEPGTYVLAGDYAGQVIVDSDADGQVRLVLDGIDIASDAGSAIDVRAADEVVVELAEGSTNALSDAADPSEDVHAALYSAADLTITGTGALEVTGTVNDGISSADGLVIQSGTLAVTAVDDGIRGQDYVVVRGGEVTVSAGGDAVKSDNEEDADRGYVWIAGGSLDLTAGDDGITAATDAVTTGGGLTVDAADDGVHADLRLVVSAGALDIVDSVEGLESGQITIEGGATSITASDDGANVSAPDSGTAEMTMVVSGGTLLVDAEGDGLDVNEGALTQTGGTVVVSGPTANGNGALDADGGVTISGGVLLAAGSAGMAVAPSAESDQATVQFTLSGAAPAGTVLTVVDAAGTALASFTAEKTVQSVVYSSDAIANGETYTLMSGGSAGDAVLGPLAAPGVAGGSSVATATAGEQVSSGMGGPGGGPGGTPGDGGAGGQPRP